MKGFKKGGYKRIRGERKCKGAIGEKRQGTRCKKRQGEKFTGNGNKVDTGKS